MLNVPNKFVERIESFPGVDKEEFLKSLSDPQPVSVRLNPFKRSGQFESDSRIQWSKEGRYLETRPSFTLDPYFHAGCYYVQEASSQYIEQAFKQIQYESPIRVLDLCAAPGGKSTHLLSLLEEGDLLVSNEVIPTRNSILRENIIKWGKPNVIVTQNDSYDFRKLGEFFDIILIDAPCSGEGLFRKDPDAIHEWSEENVRSCVRRQEEILRNAIEVLRPTGFIIYSTCTFEEEENDNQVEMLLKNYNVEVFPIERLDEKIVSTKYGLQFYPDRIKGEGFYISLIRKNGNASDRRLKKSEIKQHSLASPYLIDTKDFHSFEKDDMIYAIPSEHKNTFELISKNLYVRHAGIVIGANKRGDLVPAQSIAMSLHLNSEIKKVQLDEAMALNYLRGNDIKVDVEQGWYVVSFDGFVLGWIKSLGRRINNYYPKEWRIRMS